MSAGPEVVPPLGELDERRRRQLELIRQGVSAFARGDIEALLELCDPEIEVYMPPDLPNSGHFRGKEEYVGWMGRWLEAWEDFTIELRRLEMIGERHVVADVHQSARGRGSGIPVEMDIAYLWEVRDELLLAHHLYLDRATAIEAAERRELEAAA